MLFILFYLILFLFGHLTMTFVCMLPVLRVTCMCPLLIFFPFLVNGLHFIVALLVHVRNPFSFVIIVYIIIFIITIILFFSTLPVIGGEFSKWIWAAWSTPTHWLLWVSRRVLFLFLFNYYHYCYYFFVRYSSVTIIEVLTPSFIFIIWHHLIVMPRRQGM